MVRIVRGAGVLLIVASVLAVAAPAGAAGSAEGDLTGNLPFPVYLLIPSILLLAFVTALALGGRGEPRAPRRREGGVTRALEREHPPSS